MPYISFFIILLWPLWLVLGLIFFVWLLIKFRVFLGEFFFQKNRLLKIVIAAIVSLVIPIPILYPNPCWPEPVACIQVIDFSVKPLILHFARGFSLITTAIFLAMFILSYLAISFIFYFAKKLKHQSGLQEAKNS